MSNLSKKAAFLILLVAAQRTIARLPLGRRKKSITRLATALLCGGALSASLAATFMVEGTLHGNVCRNGAYYTIYPLANAQPVGSSCPVRNVEGTIIGYGKVTAE